MTYDTKCADLARQFLSDYHQGGIGMDRDEKLVAELAECIQAAIEDFLSEKGIS